MTKEQLEGVAIAFPDSGAAGTTNTGNSARRCLMKEHLRERFIGTVPEHQREDFRYISGTEIFFSSKLIFSFILISILFRDFVMGTAVALVVVSSSAKVASSFEDHLKTTVLGKYYLVQTLFY